MMKKFVLVSVLAFLLGGCALLGKTTTGVATPTPVVQPAAQPKKVTSPVSAPAAPITQPAPQPAKPKKKHFWQGKPLKWWLYPSR
jgi:PBP1b-binding outer membrane lipoprotein LpoB